MIPDTFPLTEFLARFPQFDDSTKYPLATLQNYGQKAMYHITQDEEGMPVRGPYRFYALFLMTAHLILIDEIDAQGDNGISGFAGTPFKATVGSVTIENTKLNSFSSDDWNYWLNQTKYGRELLAYLDTQACGGIFLNTSCDSVRDLV